MLSKQEQILTLFAELSHQEKMTLLDDLVLKTSPPKNTIKNIDSSACPHCKSQLRIKHGKRGQLQKYKCKSCCKIYTARTGTVSHNLHKVDKFEKYKLLMFEENYLTLDSIAAKVGICIKTAFQWRHRLLSIKINDDKKFDGISEIDDVWFLYSQKGRKGLDYSRKRGGSHRAGDNDFQAKLLMATDRKTKTDLSLVRIGRLKKSDIERKLSGKFTKNSTLVSDKHRSISSFAKAEGLEHVSFKASEHTAGGKYHVQKVNNMASRLKGIVNNSMRGVSTKYLQNYANWFNVKTTGISRDQWDAIIKIDTTANDIYKNMEGIYQRFIENYSRRTYRAPIKHTYKTALNQKQIAKLGYL